MLVLDQPRSTSINALDQRLSNVPVLDRSSIDPSIDLWSILKEELVHRARFRTRDEARRAIFEWNEVWYQRTRIHGAFGYVSPEAFEAAARVG